MILDQKEDGGTTRRNFLKSLGIGALALGSGFPFTGCGYVDPLLLYENSLFARETHKVLPLTKEVTKDAEEVEDAILSVVQWTQKNFFHFYRRNEENFLSGIYENYSKNFYETFTTLSIEDLFRERAVGCHLAIAVMATMLRSIGVLAEYTTECKGELGTGRDGLHGVLYIPQINRYVHGDPVADLVATSAENLLLPKEELLKYSRSARGYLELEEDLEAKDGFSLQLRRSDNYLYVAGALLPEADEGNFNQASNLLLEYELKLHPPIRRGYYREISSGKVPIKELEW